MVAFITILSAVICIYCTYKDEQYEAKLNEVRTSQSITRLAFTGYLLNKRQNYEIIGTISLTVFICGIIIMIKEVFF